MTTQLGVLESLLQDPSLSEILVHGLNPIYIERNGQRSQTDLRFESEAALRQVAETIAAMAGITLDPLMPLLDLRLSDDSHVSITLPPIAIGGITLGIRRMPKQQITWDNLLEWGALSFPMRRFLHAAVGARLNLIVSGGTASGKTTLLNALTEFFAPDERIVTVESTPELQVRHPHVLMLQSRPADIQGRGEVSLSALMEHAQKLHPDRILSADPLAIWPMLQAMGSGYEGSMFALHAVSPADALERMERLASAATLLPITVIRGQMASAVQLIVQQMRGADGVRRITHITEVLGLKEGQFVTRDIFQWVETGRGANGTIEGEFSTTGHRPQSLARLEAAGFTFADGFFDPA